MTRPQKCRRIGEPPKACRFGPEGPGREDAKTVLMSLDEFEALRLADLRMMEQKEAAAAMRVSRQTFGNILRSARGKAAQCLCEGRPLMIDGGKVAVRCRGGRGLRCGRRSSEGGTRCPDCRLRTAKEATDKGEKS